MGRLCRLERDLVAEVFDPAGRGRVCAAALVAVAAGAGAYGFAFGLWRAPVQGLYAAAKLPLVCLATVAMCTPVNAMLGQLMGARITWKETALALLVAMGITAAILGALSPVSAYVALVVPPPDPRTEGLPLDDARVVASMRVFWRLLLVHVTAMGFAGAAGYLRLYRMLAMHEGTRRKAAALVVVWTLVTGFAGCEIAWLFSPFLCKPNFPPHMVSRMYRQGNFYEHMFKAVRQVF